MTATIQPDDLLLINRGGVDYHTTVDYFKGEKGDTGPKGDDAPAIEITGPFDPNSPPPVAAAGTALIADTGEIWISDGAQWVNTGPVQGPQGEEGPAGKDGHDGLRGPAGPQGPAGDAVEIISGSSPDNLPDAPQPGQGVIDSESGSIVVWDGNSWVDIGPVQGPQGIEGPSGPAGADGKDGKDGGQGPEGKEGPPGQNAATIEINGSYDPDSPGSGSEGDAHIDENGDIWIWNGSEWVNSGPIQGPKGDPGPMGPGGPQGKQGPPGESAQLEINIVPPGDGGGYPENPEDGDAVVDDKGQIIIWNGETWVPIGLVQGPTGPEGPPGKDAEEVDTSTFAKLNDGAQTITAARFIGDGSGLTNVPGAGGGSVDLSPYAKLDGDGQEIINTAKFQCQNPNSYHDNLKVKAPDAEFLDSVRCTQIKGISSDYVSAVGANQLTVDHNLVLNDAPISGAKNITANGDIQSTSGFFVGDGSKLTNLPTGDLEGSLIFKGTVADEGSLPADAAVGDLYYREDDQHLYAKGESEWHKVGKIEDVDLSGYAQLSGADFTGNVTASSFDTGDFNSNTAEACFIQSGALQAYRDSGVNPATSPVFIGGRKTGSGTETTTEIFADGSVKSTGTITSTGGFVGDGSKLTNVPLPDFRTLTPLS